MNDIILSSIYIQDDTIYNDEFLIILRTKTQHYLEILIAI